jgi:spoIIIJ-associated protein
MLEETLEKAPKTLGTMLDYLGLDAKVKSEEKNGNVVLTVFSEDAGRIIGRKGMALNSLQLLLNRVVSKGNQEAPRIMIDVDGYRKPERKNRRPRRDDDGRKGGEKSRESTSEHEARITQQALDAAKEVKRWGDTTTLTPMNAKDRRIVHLALEKEPDLVTESITPEGEKGNYKSIVISIKK